MATNYFYPNRTERIISAGRVILAAFALYAIWLDPAEPARYAVTTYSLLVGYLCYSVILGLAAWESNINWDRLAVAIHALDLSLFAIFMFLTTGPSSPFFAFFVFSLVCAALRWQMRGTLYTAAVAIGLVAVMALYPSDILRGEGFEMNRFVIRIGYLFVVAVLLGYLGAYEQQLRRKLFGLAAWPRTSREEADPQVRDALKHAAALLAAPRILAVWEEKEEPLLHVALWSDGKLNTARERPDAFGALVAEPLADANFLCRDPLAPSPSVLIDAPPGFERREGAPLHPALLWRFSMKSVLSLALESESVSGRLFALDKARLTPDDLVLGRIVAHAVSNDLEHFYLLKRIRQTTAAEERVRLARDLHDGLLQSLTGAALQLETAHQLMQKDPQAARERLLDIQKLISAEQKNLRTHIRQLKPPYPGVPEADEDLGDRLKELAGRIERQWGQRVELHVALHRHGFPWTAAQGVYFIVHEALVNAARHARASLVRAEIRSDDRGLRIVVADNGRGFLFHGRRDHAALTELNLGPVTLRERVASLGGELAIESAGTGARLEIALPIGEKEDLI